MINEPITADIDYDLGKKLTAKRRNVVILDWTGETFDVSIFINWRWNLWSKIHSW